jgi:hypothetical protein
MILIGKCQCAAHPPNRCEFAMSAIVKPTVPSCNLAGAAGRVVARRDH